MMLTDKQFYKSALKLSIPELKKASECFFSSDESGAAAAFSAYVRAHLSYDTYFSLHPTSFSQEEREKILSGADRILEGWMEVAGYAHKYENLEVDWETNQTPTQYCEWVWCLSRHGQFITLAKAYLITGDRRYADAFAKLIESWIDQIEFPIVDADARAPSYAHTGWRTIEAGIRMSASWQYPIHVFMRDSLIPDRLVVKIFKSIWEHSFYIRHFCSSHNWLIIELTGLMNAICLYPFFARVEAWRDFVWNRFLSELDVQINADGLQYELAPGYHLGIIQNYRQVLLLARAFGIEIPEKMREGFRRMHMGMAYLSDPERCIPAVNDSDPEDLAVEFSLSESFYPEDREFRFFVPGAQDGAPPPFASYAAAHTGHCAMRTGWGREDTWLFFDSAHHGWGHQHEDKLSVQLYAYGRMLLSDSGNYDYDSSAFRRMITSTLGHNTALVDTFGQRRSKTHSVQEEERKTRERIPSDLAWCFSETCDVAEGTYDSGYGEDLIPVLHHRKVIFFKKGLGEAKPFVLLLDHFSPEDGGEHLYEVHFQLGREPIESTSHSVTVDHGDGVSLTLLSNAPVEIHTAEHEPRFMGWRKKYAPGTEHEHYPAPAPCFVLRGGEAYAVTALYPAKDEACPIASVACDPNTFSVTLLGGDVYTFDKNDIAFQTLSASERLEKGMILN